MTVVSDSNTASQADFSFQITTGHVQAGDTVYFTQTAANGNPVRDEVQITHNITPNQTDGTRIVRTIIDLEVPKIRARDVNGETEDMLSIDFERIAGNPNRAVVIQMNLLYCSMMNGTLIN
jgi:hypothetical protein